MLRVSMLVCAAFVLALCGLHDVSAKKHVKGFHGQKEPVADITKVDQNSLNSLLEPKIVSVVIVTRNHLPFLWRAAAAVFRQSYQNIELVIVEDAQEYQCNGRSALDMLIWSRGAELSQEKDAKGSIAMHLRSTDGRINYYCLKGFHTTGLKRNYAIEKAKGHYIALWDDTYLFAPHRIAYQLAYMDHAEADIVALQYSALVDAASWPIAIFNVDPKPTHANDNQIQPHYSTLFFKRSVYIKGGIRFDNLDYADQLEFVLQAQKIGARFAVSPRAVFTAEYNGFRDERLSFSSLNATTNLVNNALAPPLNPLAAFCWAIVRYTTTWRALNAEKNGVKQVLTRIEQGLWPDWLKNDLQQIVRMKPVLRMNLEKAWHNALVADDSYRATLARERRKRALPAAQDEQELPFDVYHHSKPIETVLNSLSCCDVRETYGCVTKTCRQAVCGQAEMSHCCRAYWGPECVLGDVLGLVDGAQMRGAYQLCTDVCDSSLVDTAVSKDHHRVQSAQHTFHAIKVRNDCCVAHDGADCEEQICSDAVAAVSPLCALEVWDEACVQLAHSLCEVLCKVPNDIDPPKVDKHHKH